MNKLKKSPSAVEKFRNVLGFGASAIAIAAMVPAYAQDVETVPDADEIEDRSDDVVVVTGSRLRRDEFSSSSPVQVINPEIGELRGEFDTAALVQSSSVAAGSAQVTAAISSNFVTNGGPGAQTISLRGLGAERTLVLLNGRRAGPAGTRGGVSAFDLNVIPQSVIGNVEILKDGASSTYGSDAVAGVVNIITNKSLEGLELSAFASRPMSDGGEEYRASAAFGKSLDRGHFQLAFDYYKREELQRRDRSYLDCPEEYIYDTSGNRVDVRDPRPSGTNYTGPNGYRCAGTTWGHIWLYDYQYYYTADGSSNLDFPDQIGGVRTANLAQADYDNNLGMFIPGYAAATDPANFVAPGFFPVGYNRPSLGVQNSYHEFNRNDSVIPEIERFTIYADASYEILDGVEGYIEVLANRRETQAKGSRQFWNFTLTNNFPLFGLPPDGVVENVGGAALISPTAFTDHAGSSSRVDYVRAMGGFRGDFGSSLRDWTWDIYGQYSRSDGKYTNDRILQDAVDLNDIPFRLGGTGCAGLTTPVSMRPCIDIDFNDPEFLRGNLTPSQRAFLFDMETGNTIYEQTYVEGFFQGPLFDLPGGTVQAGVGGTWRRDEIVDTPGDITLAFNAWGDSGAGVTEGSQNTKEFYGEVLLPVFSDLPMIQSFEVEGGLRFTDTSTAGSDLTWKAGVNWQVMDWLKLRGTWGTSFRAPALFELFLADQTSFLSQRSVDPCINWGANLAGGAISQRVADNCAAQGVPDNHSGAGVSATIITGGGLGVLEPETSTARTAGVVLSPNIFGDDQTLEIAVEYFDIEVNGEIATLPPGNIVLGCLDSDFFPTDPLCSLFSRGQTGAPSNINEIRASFLNINSQVNRGIDLTGRYQHEQLIDGWDFDFLAQFTRQTRDDVALFAGTTVSNNGEDGEPRWVGDANFSLFKNDWTLFWNVDFVGQTSDEQDYLDANGTLCPGDAVRGPYCLDLTAERTIVHNFSVKKDWENFSATLGMANVFDEHPPRVSVINGAEISTIGQIPFASNYEILGRRIFFNVKATF
ncbi:MAG: TonB-dependent receptor [Marinicaulis sp.]|nr:TonB-dependent receptor [Marinicaulis sp.]